MQLIQQLILRLCGRYFSFDRFSRKYPVSVKGVIFIGGEVIFLKNEREEWELPGGKLEPKEPIEECLRREIKEELNIEIEVGKLIDVWIYDILNQVEVLIITYQCTIKGTLDSLQISHEHKELGKFPIEKLKEIPLPDGYRTSILKCDPS